MEEGKGPRERVRSSSSASHLVFMVPFIMIFGVIALGGLKGSNWMFASNFGSWLWLSETTLSSPPKDGGVSLF
jgi:hypothetical protein